MKAAKKTPVCQTCNGSGAYKSGCHLIACPECGGEGLAVVATKNHTVRVMEDELSALIRGGFYVDLSFGPGWAALKWNKGEPMPEAVRQLGQMRGVPVE